MTIAVSVARAVDEAKHARDVELVVVAGGLARRHPAMVDLIAAELPARRVEPSAAPPAAKSAAAWGLRRLVELQDSIAEKGRT
jgi:hypothetical protein